MPFLKKEKFMIGVDIDEVGGYLVGARILLIDDSRPFQRLAAAMLKRMGADSLVIASNLSEGMHHLNFSDSPALSPSFDLVLMDINLPDGNGIQGCEFISKHATTHNIPVVVVSGTYDPAAIQRAFAAGAIDYLQKPLTYSLLKSRLGTLLKLKTIDYLSPQLIDNCEVNNMF